MNPYSASDDAGLWGGHRDTGPRTAQRRVSTNIWRRIELFEMPSSDSPQSSRPPTLSAFVRSLVPRSQPGRMQTYTVHHFVQSDGPPKQVLEAIAASGTVGTVSRPKISRVSVPHRATATQAVGMRATSVSSDQSSQAKPSPLLSGNHERAGGRPETRGHRLRHWIQAPQRRTRNDG